MTLTSAQLERSCDPPAGAAEDRAKAREIFKDFHILGRRWLDVAEKTEPASDFDAMIRGCTQPTSDARMIGRILDDIALALATERARVVAACATDLDEPIRFLDVGIEQSSLSVVKTNMMNALAVLRRLRALAATPPPASKETPHA